MSYGLIKWIDMDVFADIRLLMDRPIGNLSTLIIEFITLVDSYNHMSYQLKSPKKSAKHNMQVPRVAQLGCLRSAVPNTPDPANLCKSL
jgi:hypothetical protein